METKKYKMINQADANDQQPLESTTIPEALAEALDVLGWQIVAEEIDGEHDGIQKS